MRNSPEDELISLSRQLASKLAAAQGGAAAVANYSAGAQYPPQGQQQQPQQQQYVSPSNPLRLPTCFVRGTECVTSVTSTSPWNAGFSHC
jgi:hypothetical protein